MITMQPTCYSKREPNDFPYMEVPESWKSHIEECILSIDKTLKVFSLPPYTVEYDQIKEKYGRLRIYTHISMLYEELTEEQSLFYKMIEAIVCAIIDNCERQISLMIKEGKL